MLEELSSCTVYPAKHFVMPADQMKAAVGSIRDELAGRLEELNSQNKLVEAQRLKKQDGI